MYVGFCITAWANVDERLFEIFSSVLATKPELAAVVYYRINTLGGRLDLVSELMTHILPKPERKNGGHDHPDLIAWNTTQKEIKDLLADRTRIAHHPVEFTFERTPQPDDPMQPWPTMLEDLANNSSYHIYASQSERLRGRQKDAKPLDAPALYEHAMLVQRLSRVLRKFCQNTLPAHIRGPAQPKARPEKN